MRTGDNIRQRIDGRFEARYIKGRNSEGRAVYGYCYGKTLEEEALRRWVAVREMNLLILGAGSHGREVRELAESQRIFRKIAFLDDAKPGVLGPCQKLGQYVEKYPVAIPAVGNRALRMRWMAELARAGFILPVLIHPGAMVSSSAEIGCGTVVCAHRRRRSRDWAGLHHLQRRHCGPGCKGVRRYIYRLWTGSHRRYSG